MFLITCRQVNYIFLQVMSVNFSNNNVYKNFFTQTGQYSSVSNPDKKNSTATIASVKVGDIEPDTYNGQNTQEKEKMSPKKLVGIISASVGGTLLLGVLALAGLSKGSGGISKRLAKISARAKKAVFDLNAKSKDLTFLQKVKLKTGKSIQFVADSLQASSNFSAVKDSFTYHWMDKLGMKKAADGINKYFKKITLKTKNNAYKDAEYAAVDFCAELKSIAQKIKTKDPSKAKQLEEKAQQIMNEYMAGFSSQQHMARSENIWKNLDGLNTEVYNRLYKQKGGFFKNLKQFKTYITTDIIAKDRKAVFKQINSSKSKISNNISDVNSAMKQALYDLQVSVDSSNKKIVDIVKELSKNLDEAKNLAGEGEKAAREKIFKQIQTNLDELSRISVSAAKDPISSKLTQDKIATMQDLIKPESYAKGLAQEAMTDIKTILGKDSAEYQAAKKCMTKMNDKLNTAIKHEDITYEKLAELRVGSGPTDVLGIIGPAALAAMLVANSKDKDERISRTLTGGIPILGGIGMSYYGTLRGWTGAKNLVIGLLTGWLLNVVGEQTDIYAKNYRSEQSKLKNAFESLAKLQKNQNQDKQTTITG